MNMMRKNNNRNNNMKHRSGGGGNSGGRRYNNNGGGNRNNGGANDSQNIQRQKHHATQQLGKYNDMARNAQINGDRVDVEYYLQHVDHYTRVLNDIAAVEAERHAHQRESQIIPGGPNDPNAQQHQDGGSQESSGNQDSGNGDNQVSGDANAAPQNDDAPSTQQSQPRPRQQRQRYQEPDNGAHEANSNTTEIPLPGNILPPI